MLYKCPPWQETLGTEGLESKKILRKNWEDWTCMLVRNCKQPKDVVALMTSSFGVSMGGPDSPPAVKQSSENFYSHLILF